MPREDHMTYVSGNPLGIDRFRECIEKAITRYEVDQAGFDQKDLLPTAAVLAARIIDVIKRPSQKRPRICINGLDRDRNRKMVKKY